MADTKALSEHWYWGYFQYKKREFSIQDIIIYYFVRVRVTRTSIEYLYLQSPDRSGTNLK